MKRRSSTWRKALTQSLIAHLILVLLLVWQWQQRAQQIALEPIEIEVIDGGGFPGMPTDVPLPPQGRQATATDKLSDRARNRPMPGAEDARPHRARNRDKGHDLSTRKSKKAHRPRVRARKNDLGSAKHARGRGTPAPLDHGQGKQLPCLLSMRGCKGDGAKPAEVERKSRLWSFGKRRASPAKELGRLRLGVYQSIRYADGGHTMRSTSGAVERPSFGTLGLLRLASRRINGRSAARACNPYRGRRFSGNRTLVLLVDTSSSIKDSGSAPTAVLCAAGAALAALKRGFYVEIVNFSSRAIHLKPTRNIDQVYLAVSRIQAQGSTLPPPYLVGGDARVRDLVVVTDAAIDKAKKYRAGYRRVIRSHAGNTARMFLIGSGNTCTKCLDDDRTTEVCKRCEERSREGYEQLVAAGFRPTRL